MGSPIKLLVISEPLGHPADVSAEGGSLDVRYSFYLEKSGLFMQAGNKDIEKETKVIASFTGSTQRQLKQRMKEMTAAEPPDFDDYVINIGSIGSVYYTSFIPEKVQQYIRDLPRNPPPYVYIYAKNHWIPWDLVYDSEGQFFWGEKCIIVRIPMLDYTSRQSARTVLASGRRQIASVVNVVGDQVAEHLAPSDSSLLALDMLSNKSKTFDCNYQNGTWKPRTVSSLKAKVNGSPVSILHFTCHGRYDKEDGYYLQLHAAAEHPKSYRLDTLNVQSHLRLDNTLVFVNACTSDVPSLHYGTFINLGRQFFESGAEAFIGTIAPVPIPRAVRLASIFYGYLLEGEAIGMALHRTKMEMKAEGNPFYLFYCLYGDAYRRFRP
jgi:hypothetical protein